MFAGLTVIIALLGLLVVGIPFLSVMGVARRVRRARRRGRRDHAAAGPARPGSGGKLVAEARQPRRTARAIADDDGGRPTMGRALGDRRLKAPDRVRSCSSSACSARSRSRRSSLDLNLPDGGAEARGLDAARGLRPDRRGLRARLQRPARRRRRHHADHRHLRATSTRSAHELRALDRRRATWARALPNARARHRDHPGGPRRARRTTPETKALVQHDPRPRARHRGRASARRSPSPGTPPSRIDISNRLTRRTRAVRAHRRRPVDRAAA